jgi:hypothetical protein
MNLRLINLIIICGKKFVKLIKNFPFFYNYGLNEGNNLINSGKKKIPKIYKYNDNNTHWYLFFRKFMYPLILDYYFLKENILKIYKTGENQFNEKFFMENCKITINLLVKRNFVPIGSKFSGNTDLPESIKWKSNKFFLSQFNLEELQNKVKFTFKQKYHEIPKKGMIYFFLGIKKYKGVSYYYGGDLKNLKRTKRTKGKKENERLQRFKEFKEKKEDLNDTLENLDYLNIENNDDEDEIKFKRKLKKKFITKRIIRIHGENFESVLEPFEYLIFDFGDISKQYFDPPLKEEFDTNHNSFYVGFTTFFLMNSNFNINSKDIEEGIIERKLKKGIIKIPTITIEENKLFKFSKKYGIFFNCGNDHSTDISIDNNCQFEYDIEEIKFEDGKIDMGF